MSEKIKTETTYPFISKSIIVLFFLSVFAIFLYFPRIYNFFVQEKGELVIYITRETIDLKIFEEFEEKTGIRVRPAYFDTNEEMFAKFKINRGKGYDIVVPSDYMVESLVSEGLLQPIDRSKITNFSKLDRRLLNKFFDPENRYTLPLNWIPYGIGFDKNVFVLDNDMSWDIAFKKDSEEAKKIAEKIGDYKISMLNDSREAVFLASIYLFGSVENITQEKLEQIKDTLIEQKKMVEAYTETGAKYLLVSGVAPFVVLPSARMKELDDPENYGFIIPREGSLVDIMNLGIPVSSKKSNEAHLLIDFLLSKKVGAYNFEMQDCNPSNVESYELIDKSYSKNKAFFPDDKVFDQLHPINNNISPQLLEKVWFLVKSAYSWT